MQAPLQADESDLKTVKELTKELHQSLFVLMKANHHKVIMEEVLTNQQPPNGLNTTKKIIPNIYRGTAEVHQLFREVTDNASMKLVGILFKHYSKVVKDELDHQKQTHQQFTTLLSANIPAQRRTSLKSFWDTSIAASNSEVKGCNLS